MTSYPLVVPAPAQARQCYKPRLPALLACCPHLPAVQRAWVCDLLWPQQQLVFRWLCSRHTAWHGMTNGITSDEEICGCQQLQKGL